LWSNLLRFQKIKLGTLTSANGHQPTVSPISGPYTTPVSPTKEVTFF
jgi:hypothetical protein